MNGCVGALTVVRQAPIVVGSLDEGLGVLRVERVHHIEEVLPVRPTALRKLVREVSHKASVILELWVEGIDAELIVPGHIYLPLLSESEQLLFLNKYHSEEILVDHSIRGHV